MPTWDEVLNEGDKNYTPLALLEKYIGELSKHTKRTTICYMSAFTVLKQPVHPIFQSIIDQDMQGFMACSKGVDKANLDLVIHTPGGDYEATKRIISYLHETYKHIRVFIPHMAMSGGTLIACAADEIYMGPYSSLGPTDPQIILKDAYVPIHAIIDEFEKAFKDVSTDPQKALLWSERLKQIPFGKLKAVEIMKENSLKYLIDILKERNCRGKDIEKIQNAADFLNSGGVHSSHGRGLSLKNIKENELNVVNLKNDKILEDCILSTYHAATVLFQKTVTQKFIINNFGKKYIINS